MKFTLSWLLRFIDTDATLNIITDALINFGIEVVEISNIETDVLIHINATPNISDISVLGIARILAAQSIGTLKMYEIPQIQDNFQSKRIINVDSNICSAYYTREITGISNIASPPWLIKLLNDICIKPISAPLDIANYILYSFGQPLFIYDANKLDNTINIGLYNNLVNFVNHNDKISNLQFDDIVVYGDKIYSLAGIENISAIVSHNTNAIVIESAVFSELHISKTSRRLHINNDVARKFIRGVDPTYTKHALDIATSMILSICGGVISGIISKACVMQQKAIEFSINFFQKITGLMLSQHDVCVILTNLGFTLSNISNDKMIVTVPPWKNISIPEELVEEILRVYGCNNIPNQYIANAYSHDIDQFGFNTKIKMLLSSIGYIETYTWSFMKMSDASQFIVNIRSDMLLLNAISGLDYMRPSIVPNLLSAVSINHARSINDLALFEVGQIFANGIFDKKDEHNVVTVIKCGNSAPINPYNKKHNVNIFDIKSDLDLILQYFNINYDLCDNNLSYYCTEQSGSMMVNGQYVAIFGLIADHVLRHFGLTSDVFAFELSIDNLIKCINYPEKEFVVSNFQTIRRDLVFIFDLKQRVGPVISFIKDYSTIVQSVVVFDVYHDQDMQLNNKKSVAFSIYLQSQHHTLTENEISTLINNIITEIDSKFSGQLRSTDIV